MAHVHKQCSCGCQYTEAEWLALVQIGTHIGDIPVDMRNCVACGSTMGISPEIGPACEFCGREVEAEEGGRKVGRAWYHDGNCYEIGCERYSDF